MPPVNLRQHLREHIARQKKLDKIFVGVGLFCLNIGLVTLAVLLIDLSVDGLSRFSHKFFFNFPSRFADEAGILSAWVGSLMVIFVTAVAAVPLGIFAGVYLEEYAPKNWVTEVIEINIANLAGVPSIVYGLMALGLFIYKFGFGQSVLTAGLTLGLLILPTVIMSTREAIRAIPASIREAAYAVGATKWEAVRDHVIPYSVSGITTGVIIGISRALGESAPLLTIGALTFIAFLPDPPLSAQFPFLSFQWLSSPFTVLSIQMFNWVSRPQQAFHLNAAAAGLVLLTMTLTVNGIAIYIRYRARKRIKW